jgi:tetratricopeptide (TPR) repeat protein
LPRELAVVVVLGASTLGVSLCLSPGVSAASVAETPSPKPESPLVAYALELSPVPPDDPYSSERELQAALHELERHPPPRREACSRTLGASRFATQYEEIAAIHLTMGEFGKAIRANEAALACAPRDAGRYADIAAAHLGLGHIAEARAAVERGMAIDPDEHELLGMRAQLDFLEERWANATAYFRLLALDKIEDNWLTKYDQCFFWLAQRRAGVRQPELIPRDKKWTGWPMPILDTLTGAMTEAELAATIRDGPRDEDLHRWLAEALYYVGELRLAEGDVETARRHFASVVNLRKLSDVEYGMARAELARLREKGSR